MKTKITELFGIQHPIVQGGMHYVGFAELAAAVSNAGGLGIITGLTQRTPDALAAEIRRCRQMTDKPFGVNLTFLPIVIQPDYPGFVRAIIEGGVKIVETAGNNPQKWLPALKDAGIKVIHKCTSVRHSLKAQSIGCDAVSVDGTARALVAQGLGIWTVALVRQLVPIFHALGDTRTPVWVSFLDLVSFVALALGLRGRLGHVGVSVAISGSSFVQMALLLMYLRRALPELGFGLWLGSFARHAVAAAFAGLAAFGAARVSPRLLGQLLPLGVGFAAFGAVFVTIAYGLGSVEQRTILGGIARRLRRRG